MPGPNEKTPVVRVSQAVALLAGALVLVVFVAPDGRDFYWTPLVLGLTYLGAALAGGRHGGHWATACGLTGWGAGVAVAGYLRPELDAAGLYLLGAGAGMVAGVLLDRAGADVSMLGLAVTVMAGGLLLALTARVTTVIDDARTYAVYLALVGVVNLLIAARAGLDGRQRAATG